MRIAELRLERYGRFENHTLAFPKRERDFHLVSGLNEAGKTTSLAALADLLFGFEHNASYDFRFGAPLLRIGAILEQDATRLACRRRRGRQNTLIDADDKPMDETLLTAMLRGQQRNGFLLSSSLDHARLRQGGEAMAESKDDLGQMLFAAGSGLTGLKAVLKELDDDLDGLWGPRRSEKRAYTRAEKTADDARRALRDAALKPVEWTKARDERDRAQVDRDNAEQDRRHAAAALADIERLRRVYVPLRRRALLRADLMADTTVALPEPVEAAALDALKTAIVQEQRRNAAQALLAGVQARLAANSDDDGVLALADRIERLMEQIGAESDRRQHLPRRQTEFAEELGNAKTAAARLNLVIGDALDVALPASADVARLRQLAGSGTQIRTRVDDARQRAQHAEQDVIKADAALADAPIPEGLETMRPAIDTARRAGDLDAQVEEKRNHAATTERRLKDALATLIPWAGDVETLARLVPPSDPTIDAEKIAWTHAEREATDAKRALLTVEQTLEQAQTHLTSLSAAGEAVSAERLNSVRTDRNAILSAMQDHVDGVTPVSDPKAEIRRLGNAIHAADDVADRRYAAADASAKLAQAEALVVDLMLKRDQASRQVTQTANAMIQQRTAWETHLVALGLPNVTPDELRAWLARRTQALATREQLETANADLKAITAKRLRHLVDLTAALGLPEPVPDTAFTPMLTRAETHGMHLEKQAEAFMEKKREAKLALDRLHDAQRELGNAEHDQRSWNQDWETAVKEAGLTALDPASAETRLSVYETLRAHLEAAGKMRHRITALEADADAFATEARAVAMALGLEAAGRDPLELASLVKNRLATARDVRTRRNALEADAKTHQAEVDGAQAALDAAEAALSDARRLTGCADRVILAAALDGSQRRRKWEADIAALENEITRQGDGHSLAALEAACATETEETLATRAATLSHDANDRAKQAQEAGERAAQAQLRFDHLDTRASVADAALDLEQARAEMEVQAEIYLLKRTQRMLLDYAMRQQAERHRTPLLADAAILFKRLTLGRYIDLRADYETDKPRLLGLTADGQSGVTTSDMSEGTQDQLFLALRLAAIRHAHEAGMHLPFLADDLFVTFDDDRARAGLEVLGELSRTTQVLFFTHHAHLKALAAEVFSSDGLSVQDLSQTVA